MTTTRFSFLLAATSLLLMVFAFLSLQMGWLPVPQVIFFVVPAYAILTYFLYRQMKQAALKSPQRFVTAFMGSVTIKLMITAAFLAIYIYQHKETKVPVALWTFSVYVVFPALLVSAFQNQEPQKG
jgi:uncharacterized membrane protein YsdA (DUF1294 family)